jgi:hypothetical protein
MAPRNDLIHFWSLAMTANNTPAIPLRDDDRDAAHKYRLMQAEALLRELGYRRLDDGSYALPADTEPAK